MTRKIIDVIITAKSPRWQRLERRADLLAAILDILQTAAAYEDAFKRYNAVMVDFEREIAERIKAESGDA